MTPITFEKDGIYLNDTDFVVMLVDEDMPEGILVGDYSGDGIYVPDSHTSLGNTMTTTGLSYVSSDGWEYDDSIKIDVQFDEYSADLSATVDNLPLLYSFDRTGDSLDLTDIAGTHTDPDDGSTWFVDTSGNFTINGTCTVTATFSKVKGYYYKAENVVASGCSDPDFNAADYTAVLLTVNQSGIDYILAAMSNDNGILWGSTPITP